VRLYALIDGRESEAEFAALVRQVIEGGVEAIQLRDKTLSDRELIARARLLVAQSRGRELVAPKSHDPVGSGLAAETTGSLLVIVNDRADIAAIADADGVHLGQDDMSVKDARGILGPRKLIGVSAHSIEQARAAVLAGANYIGVGPTFASKTKEFAAFPGVALLRQVAAEIRLPAFAIGGIDQDNIVKIRKANINRVAVSSAVTAAKSPRDAASRLLAVLQNVDS
jgi:thiamine-phosphate pyrophosphorylase